MAAHADDQCLLRTRWIVRLRLALESRRAAGDTRAGKEILADIITNFIERGLIRREGGRLFFMALDGPIRK